MAREIRVKFELNLASAAINLPRFCIACGTVSRGVGFCPMCRLAVRQENPGLRGRWEGGEKEIGGAPHLP